MDLVNSEIILKEEDIKDIISQVILGLFHLHNRNIIYGDLKAENILIKSNGQVKLCDFNLSGSSSILE